MFTFIINRIILCRKKNVKEKFCKNFIHARFVCSRTNKQSPSLKWIFKPLRNLSSKSLFFRECRTKWMHLFLIFFFNAQRYETELQIAYWIIGAIEWWSFHPLVILLLSRPGEMTTLPIKSMGPFRTFQHLL